MKIYNSCSGPALCNAGQHYPKRGMIYMILTHLPGSDLFMYSIYTVD
jgi:hypothetical protein